MKFWVWLFSPFYASANFSHYEVGILRLYVPIFDLYSEPVTANIDGSVSILPNKFGLIFRIEPDGSVREMRRQRYLSANMEEKLILTMEPDKQFSILRSTMCLASRGLTEFQVCEDLSVAFQCDCANPYPAFFQYEEFKASDIYEELRG